MEVKVATDLISSRELLILREEHKWGRRAIAIAMQSRDPLSLSHDAQQPSSASEAENFVLGKTVLFAMRCEKRGTHLDLKLFHESNPRQFSLRD